MFNIKNGRVSLDVSCTPGKVVIRVAPDNQSFTPIVTSIVKSERNIANMHLRHFNQDSKALDKEEHWMGYYRKRGYVVREIIPEEFRK